MGTVNEKQRRSYIVSGDTYTRRSRSMALVVTRGTPLFSRNKPLRQARAAHLYSASWCKAFGNVVGVFFLIVMACTPSHCIYT